MVILMLGAPGTGKGTISALLTQYYGIPHIGTGDVLRDAIAKNGKDAELIRSYTDNGKLVPDEVIIKLMEQRLKMLDCKEGFILDGFPRTVEQAEAFYPMLKRLKKTITAVINLETTEEEIIDRVIHRLVCPKCKAVYNIKTMPPITAGICDYCDTKLVKRPDDTEEKIKERLLEYHEKTEKLVDYYKQTDKLFTVIVSSQLGKLGKDVLKEVIWYIEGKNND